MTRFQELLGELQQLHLPSHKYAIFGSGPLAVRGLRDVNDLDLIATDTLFAALGGRYGYTQPDKIDIGAISIFSSWPQCAVTPARLVATADTIDGVRYVRLEHVRAWKARLGRPKDVADVALIDEYLANV